MEGVSYPVNQQTYPPDQSYTIQQYPPQLPGYVQSQQPGYPLQEAGYSPAVPTVPITYPVGGYKGDAPPPYYGHQQALPQQQQSSTNVVVVQQQPIAVYTRTVNASGDNFFTLSVVLTILCFLCGTWYALLCTVPAIIFASAAKEAESRGVLAEARQKRNAALICNITACVSWVMITLILIVVPIAVITTRSSSVYNYNYNDYNDNNYYYYNYNDNNYYYYNYNDNNYYYYNYNDYSYYSGYYYNYDYGNYCFDCYK